MKNSSTVLLAIELPVITLVSLAASYALLGTNSLFLVPFTVLVALGVLTTVILPIGASVFSAGAVIMTLPALMKLNNVKWWVFSPERLAFCPDLGLPAGLGIGLLVISGSLFLGYLQPLRRDLKSLRKAGADAEECRAYMINQRMIVGAAVLSGAVLALVIVVAISAARAGLAAWLGRLSWALPVAGLVSSIVLALGLFWFMSSHARTTHRDTNPER